MPGDLWLALRLARLVTRNADRSAGASRKQALDFGPWTSNRHKPKSEPKPSLRGRSRASAADGAHRLRINGILWVSAGRRPVTEIASHVVSSLRGSRQSPFPPASQRPRRRPTRSAPAG